jgi:hypothetical protein
LRRDARWRLGAIALALLIAACAQTPTARKAVKKATATPATVAAGSAAPGDQATGGPGDNPGGTGNKTGTPAATQPPAIRTGSLAIALDQGQRTQALDGVVAKVRFSVSGPNLAASASQEVAKAAFVGGKATARFDDLVPGPVTVDAQVFDADGRLLGQGRGGPVEVAAGQSSALDLSFGFASGSVTVTLDGPIAPTPSIALGSGS